MPVGKGQAIYKLRQLFLFCRAQFYAIPIKHFQSVVAGRIVACGNHHAEVAAEFSHEMPHGICRQHAEIYYVAAAVIHAACQCAKQFFARVTRVPSHYHNRAILADQCQTFA